MVYVLAISHMYISILWAFQNQKKNPQMYSFIKDEFLTGKVLHIWHGMVVMLRHALQQWLENKLVVDSIFDIKLDANLFLALCHRGG